MIKPSDAKAWASCLRRVWLDNKGGFEQAPIEDAFEQLIIDLGLDHEEAVLNVLLTKFDVHTATSVEHTTQLMSEGAQVIYQAQLIDEDEGLSGYPDFLIRHESGEYQPADAKFSLNEDKKEIRVQLGFYRHMLGSKLNAIVFLGDGSEAPIGDDANTVTNQFITEMRELLASDSEPSVYYSHSKCRSCPYYQHCKPKFEADEDLSLLYGVQGRAAIGLKDIGISTITELSKADPANIDNIPYLKAPKKVERAIYQAKSYLTNEIFKLKEIDLPEGNWVHFDIEDNPLTLSGNKHVYLWGFLVPEYGSENFEYVWTDSEEEDFKGWKQFLNKIEEYMGRYTDLYIAHYSTHEVSTIRSYAKRYDMMENDIVQYLLGDDSPLFDIQKPVLESLVLPLQGYGLKDICKHKDLVNFQWQDEESGSQWSVVQFNNFLNASLEDKLKLKLDILGYNRDDVIATRKLEEWLRAL